MARLVVRAAFLRDLEARVAWLEENAPEEWLEGFREGLESVGRHISRYPQSGAPLEGEGGMVVRAKSFPGRLPHVVYYAHRAGLRVDVVYLARLFHYRQRRPIPRVRRWPS